jgi:hypothetical protein
MSTQKTNGEKQIEAILHELNERLDDVRVSIELFELGERIKQNPAARADRAKDANLPICTKCGDRWEPLPAEIEALYDEHNDLAEEIYILESKVADYGYDEAVRQYVEYLEKVSRTAL